jgi:CO dehydrogenase/acetyl-CoA synthase gamma subunit (corrinoid Fe-S protein)
MKSWWRDGWSIDEARFSTIGLLLIIGFIFSLTVYIIDGDFTDALLNLLIALITAFSGISVAHAIGSMITTKKKSEIEDEEEPTI